MTSLLDVCSKTNGSCETNKGVNGVYIENNEFEKNERRGITQAQKLALHQKLTSQSGFNSVVKPLSAKVPNNTLTMFTKMLNKQRNAYHTKLNESFVGNSERGWKNINLSTRKADIIVVLTLLSLLFWTIC